MGRKYYNNGIKNVMIKDGDPIPDGFVLGMVKRSKEEREKSNQKRKETNLKKYGGPAPLSSSEVRDKVKQTNIEKYGVENPSQSEGIKSKRTNTMIERYGVENAMGSKELKERQKDTVRARYGVDNVFQNEDVKERIRRTNMSKYGVSYPSQSKVIRAKIKDSTLESYGVQFPLQSNEIKSKVGSTNIGRYGSKCPLNNEDIKRKAKETLMKHYGVDNPAKSNEVQIKIQQTNNERYGADYAFMLPEYHKGHSRDSKPNLAFKEILDSKGISYEREFPLGNYKYLYDFRVGSFLIEIDPFATHNVVWNPYGDCINADYHKDKSNLATENGYQCIHVFDWDDLNKIIRILGTRDTVYARKCVIKEVSVEDTISYLDTYHLQGSCNGQLVRLGLYYNDNLVSLMTFGKPRYSQRHEWELLRYCSHVNVIGGAEKLFKHFLKLREPKSIISYCDNAKFGGKVYSLLKFKLISKGRPTIHWYSPKEKNHITSNLLRQRGYDRLFNENYGKGSSNVELIINRGYFPIYDCGQSVWVYVNDGGKSI